ncbi:MAG: TonB-dependent receptor [Candidatus Acidiferrales bacterium]
MGTYRKSMYASMFWAVAFLLAAISVAAQLPTGTILGVAKDASGASVANVKVTVTNVDTGLARVVMTGEDGAYRTPELAVGHYEVKAERMGFKTDTRKGITLEVTQQAVINFTLEVGSTTQEVVVNEEASVVNTQDATLGGLVNEQSVQDLPLNGRNYVDLSLLQAGVNDDRNGAGNGATTFSVNGAGVRSNNFTLDGAVTTTQEGRNPGNAGNTLGVDGIKEYRIITSNFSAEYGLAMGSQVVVVSKNGTNQFHGDAFEFLRNSAMDAKNFFDKPGVKIPEFQKNQFGGAFGGPIKKDKTFFFANFEGLRQNLGVTQNNAVPNAGCHPADASAANNWGAGETILPANCPDIVGSPYVTSADGSVVLSQYTAEALSLYPNPNSPAVGNGLPHYQFSTENSTIQNYGQIRVDQNFTDNDLLFVRFTIDNAVVNTPNPDILLNGQAVNVSQANDRNQYLTLSENHIFSPSVLNTARLSFSRTDVHTAGVDKIMGPSITPGEPAGNYAIGGVNGGSYTEVTAGATVPTFDLQNIYTLSDDISWTKGKHAFKFGTLINRWNEGVESSAGIDGQLQYGDLAGFMLSDATLIEFQTPGANGNRFSVFDTFGFYGQDDWRITPRLTLNLGLRYEFMTVPREINGRQSRVINDFTDPFTIGPIIENNTKHDFSPRIGLAWDVFGDGKTSLRAGAGIYYDIGNIGGALEQDVIGSPPFSGLSDIFAPAVKLYWPVVLPLPPSTLNTPSDVTPQFIDYDYKSPYMIQYNVSVQRQLPWDMGLSVGYVGNHGVHLATIRESNPIIPTSFGACGDPASLCVNGQVPFWDISSPNYHPINPNMPSTINIGTASQSRYNALQIVLNKRTTHGLEFQTSFTHSLVTDDTQGQENVRDCHAAAGLQGVYPLNPSVDNGPACFNIPNNWEFSVVYHFPTMTGSGFLPKAANGWWVGTIASAQSGVPFSVITADNRSNSGVLQGQNDRVNINTPALLAAYPCTSHGIVAGQPGAGNNPCPYYTPVAFNASTVITNNINQWYNPAMFSLAPNCTGPGLTGCSSNIGQLGTSGRDILYGPHTRNWDFSVVKDTKLGFLGEAGNLEFRAEMFNILNHPNFATPSSLNYVGDPGDLTPFSEKAGKSAGAITSTIQTPRQIQLSLRVEF